MKALVYFCSLWLILGFDVAANNPPDTLFWSGTIDIYENLYIDEQTTLVISPGTVVTVHNQSKIQTNGNVFANGQLDNNIYFTTTDTLGISDTATILGGWKGIHLLNNPNATGIFSNCVFEFGKANVPGSWTGFEGAEDTTAANMGGVFRSVNYGKVQLLDCVFRHNFARTNGGAIYCLNTDTLLVHNSFFHDNYCLNAGGGIFSYDHLYAEIAYSNFYLNKAWHGFEHAGGMLYKGKGSAIFLYNRYPFYSFNYLSGNMIHNNFSQSSVFIDVKESVFCNNLVTNNFNGRSVVFARLPSTNKVFNNTIANNWFWQSLPGLLTASENILIYNNILWNNLSPDPKQYPVIRWYYNEPTVFHNLIWEGRAPGGPMITDDPLFVNPAPGYGLDYNGWEYDWSLQDISPAVNTGTPDTTGLFIPPYDLLGNPRIFGGRIDMGAYENQNVWVSLPNNPLVSARLVAAPNPFRNAFTVELFGPEKVKRITVYNQTGTPVRQMETLWHEGLAHIDMNGFAAGLYVLAVEYENGTVRTEKMVKL